MYNVYIIISMRLLHAQDSKDAYYMQYTRIQGAQQNVINQLRSLCNGIISYDPSIFLPIEYTEDRSSEMFAVPLILFPITSTKVSHFCSAVIQ